MDHIKLTPQPAGSPPGSPPSLPITEADLHAYVDHQTTPTRQVEVAQYLASRPDEAARVLTWQQDKQMLRATLNTVLDEPLPLRLQRMAASSAVSTARASARTLGWRGVAAGMAIAVASAGSSWFVRGAIEADAQQRLVRAERIRMGQPLVASDAVLSGFARRAAVAHVVYSPDVRRPVEVGAEQEQQLVAWLSKRLGTEVRPPVLKAIGYELIGGRLLPGDNGPVAQFMYHDAIGQRLTLYVTREAPKFADRSETAFRFGQDGPVNVFYWVDKDFGYALSGGIAREELTRVAHEVYRQLAPA